MVRSWIIVAALWSSLPVVAARADEQMRTTVVSGQWAAVEHHPSMVSPPDVCAVINPLAKIAFRAADGVVEFRVSDDSWALPASVEGEVRLLIGQITYTLKVVDNTATTVSALVDEARRPEIFAAMDNASSMTVTVGTGKPRPVSLGGSTRATNAFLTCAGLKGPGSKEGANPFTK